MKSFIILWTALLSLLPGHFVMAGEIALVGTEYATRHFRKNVTDPIGKEVFISTFNEFPVADYAKYKAVVLLELQSRKEREKGERNPSVCWDYEGNVELIREALKQGTRILLVGVTAPKVKNPRNLVAFEEILGYTQYPKKEITNPARINQSVPDSPLAGSPTDALQWVGKELNMTVGNVTRADTLALATGTDGLDYPLITRNRVGEGVVYWFGSSPFRLAVTPDVEEKSLEAYLNLFRKILNE